MFVVLATANIRELPTEVELGTADGMPRACVLNADHVASLPKGYEPYRAATAGQCKLGISCIYGLFVTYPVNP